MSKTINYEIFLYIAIIFVISVNPFDFTLLKERYYELLESVTAEKELKIL